MWKLLKFLKNTREVLITAGALLAAAVVVVEPLTRSPRAGWSVTVAGAEVRPAGLVKLNVSMRALPELIEAAARSWGYTSCQ